MLHFGGSKTPAAMSSVSAEGAAELHDAASDEALIAARAKLTLSEKLWATVTNRYNCANAVYLLYAIIMMFIDFQQEPKASADAPASDDYGAYGYTDPYAAAYTDTQGNVVPASLLRWVPGTGWGLYDSSLATINKLYTAAASIHVINAVMYVWMWLGVASPPTLFSRIMVPEYLNIAEASFYLYTASTYENQLTYGPGAYADVWSLNNHKIEMTAAMVQSAASFGWCYTWWLTHTRGKYRGLTIVDPDFWANVFVVIPSLVYITYNCMTLAWPESYAYNSLYTVADCMYLVGAIFYILCGLRDDGWFTSLAELHVPMNLSSAVLYAAGALSFWLQATPIPSPSGLSLLSFTFNNSATTPNSDAPEWPAYQAAASFLLIAFIFSFITGVFGLLPQNIRNAAAPHTHIILTGVTTMFGLIGTTIACVKMNALFWSGILPEDFMGERIWGPALSCAIAALVLSAFNTAVCLVHEGIIAWLFTMMGCFSPKVHPFRLLSVFLNAAALSLFAAGALTYWTRDEVNGVSFTLLARYTDGVEKGLSNVDVPQWPQLQAAAALLLIAFAIAASATFLGALHAVDFVTPPTHTLKALTTASAVCGFIGLTLACHLLASPAQPPFAPRVNVTSASEPPFVNDDLGAPPATNAPSLNADGSPRSYPGFPCALAGVLVATIHATALIAHATCCAPRAGVPSSEGPAAVKQVTGVEV